MTSTYDVVGIGNAMVDVISPASDTFLDHMGITKGIMQLIERDRAEVLYAAMESRVETPGGSVANTLAGLGQLGLQTGFVGRVADDALGRFYADAMTQGGTEFVNAPTAGADLPTSRSMIFVSPDGERSMNTFLGESTYLGSADVPTEVMKATRFLFLEGYLFDKDDNKAAFNAASAACRKGGGAPGISLSDPFCVDRHRDDFRKLVRDEMAFVIGNEDEWKSLYQVTDVEQALAHAMEDCQTLAFTRSGDPVIVFKDGERADVPIQKVVPVDATGAGDQFAAGFLYGLAEGRAADTCGRMGAVAAAEVISHVGPRPEADLKGLFQRHGLV
ncbi:adenosine kinase [Aestuariibius insulae]|uniref:adenosine kinase n=1 Tax=Aestuariibius insulae TaxID=2058287 RepID=UPI00345EFC85